MSDPMRVKTLNATTRPAITRYGRHRETVGSVESPRALIAPPDKKITGRTGRMHGEMPVISPPRNPMRARLSTGSSMRS
jgi:hypothetical protein